MQLLECSIDKLAGSLFLKIYNILNFHEKKQKIQESMRKACGMKTAPNNLIKYYKLYMIEYYVPYRKRYRIL